MSEDSERVENLVTSSALTCQSHRVEPHGASGDQPARQRVIQKGTGHAQAATAVEFRGASYQRDHNIRRRFRVDDPGWNLNPGRPRHVSHERDLRRRAHTCRQEEVNSLGVDGSAPGAGMFPATGALRRVCRGHRQPHDGGCYSSTENASNTFPGM